MFNGKERYIPETKYGFYIYPDNEKKYSSEELLAFERDAVVIHYWRSHPWASQIGMSPCILTGGIVQKTRRIMRNLRRNSGSSGKISGVNI